MCGHRAGSHRSGSDGLELGHRLYPGFQKFLANSASTACPTLSTPALSSHHFLSSTKLPLRCQLARPPTHCGSSWCGFANTLRRPELVRRHPTPVFGVPGPSPAPHRSQLTRGMEQLLKTSGSEPCTCPGPSPPETAAWARPPLASGSMDGWPGECMGGPLCMPLSKPVGCFSTKVFLIALIMQCFIASNIPSY